MYHFVTNFSFLVEYENSFGDYLTLEIKLPENQQELYLSIIRKFMDRKPELELHNSTTMYCWCLGHPNLLLLDFPCLFSFYWFSKLLWVEGEESIDVINLDVGRGRNELVVRKVLEFLAQLVKLFLKQALLFRRQIVQ